MRAVNLIPADQRGGASVGAGRSEGAVYAVLALVAGVAVLMVLYGVAGHQISNRRSEADSIAAKVSQAEVETTALTPYTSFIAMREERQQAVSTLVNERFDWAHAFHEFGRVLPSNIAINSLEGTIAAVAAEVAPEPAAAAPAATTPTSTTTAAATPEATTTTSTVSSATPPGSVPTFTMAGCATSQPAVAQMLERLRLIDGVKEVALQSSTAASEGGAAGAGGCPAKGPAFTVQITFEGLPSATEASSKANTVADTASAPAATTTTTTGTGNQ
ncbi:MAG TPA: hypothetical protein VH025_00905 [Solirubrobacteraceae bacterium]|jgi:Tfp pilus assembly protein PilN|nr:hypothetical protein [Solirubrobacteraceae bacterium]